jgi:hypothetical protein
MRVLICMLSLLLFGAAWAQDELNVIPAQGGSATQREASVSIASMVIQPGVETYVAADSWGKTWQDAEREEARLKASARTLVNHSERLSQRRYGGTLAQRYKDGQPIYGLHRAFIVRMVHAMRGGRLEWSIGLVDYREILIGRRVGRHVYVTLMPDGRVRRRIVETWEVTSTFRCDNQTQGMVWTQRVTVETPVVIRERTHTHSEREVVRDREVVRTVFVEEGYTPPPAAAGPQIVMVPQGHGPGPIMSPMSVYTRQPMAPVYIMTGKAGERIIKVVCPPPGPIKPGDPPVLPVAPPPPPIGTPPNNPAHYPLRDGSEIGGPTKKKVGI